MVGDSRKLGIGIQDFKKLREGGYVYVDKTDYLYRLVSLSTPFFLSRPRRFGKSLFLSMLRYYWEGERGLFKGLAIEKLIEGDEHAWSRTRYSILISIRIIILSTWH